MALLVDVGLFCLLEAKKLWSFAWRERFSSFGVESGYPVSYRKEFQRVFLPDIFRRMPERQLNHDIQCMLVMSIIGRDSAARLHFDWMCKTKTKSKTTLFDARPRPRPTVQIQNQHQCSWSCVHKTKIKKSRPAKSVALLKCGTKNKETATTHISSKSIVISHVHSPGSGYPDLQPQRAVAD